MAGSRAWCFVIQTGVMIPLGYNGELEVNGEIVECSTSGAGGPSDVGLSLGE
jgi:hypothetical protein